MRLSLRLHSQRAAPRRAPREMPLTLFPHTNSKRISVLGTYTNAQETPTAMAHDAEQASMRAMTIGGAAALPLGQGGRAELRRDDDFATLCTDRSGGHKREAGGAGEEEEAARASCDAEHVGEEERSRLARTAAPASNVAMMRADHATTLLTQSRGSCGDNTARTYGVESRTGPGADACNGAGTQATRHATRHAPSAVALAGDGGYDHGGAIEEPNQLLQALLRVRALRGY